jgi:hypothetical protein
MLSNFTSRLPAYPSLRRPTPLRPAADVQPTPGCRPPPTPQPTPPSRAARSRKPDSGHAGIISTTVRVRRANWNAMQPRIQCVPAQ